MNLIPVKIWRTCKNLSYASKSVVNSNKTENKGSVTYQNHALVFNVKLILPH